MRKNSFAALKPDFETVILPFLTSRSVLVLAGLLSYLFRASESYPIPFAVQRGWQFTPIRVLDMWARWDTGWYYSIVGKGYLSAEGQSNLAFFPLYPFLIKASNYFLLDLHEHRTTFTLLAILIANLAFVGALLILSRILAHIQLTPQHIRKTIWLIVIFPLSFFFSAAYTESIFLFFMAASLYFSLKRSWWLCALTAALAVLTRPLAQLIVIPIAVTYLAHNRFRIRWKDVAAFAVVPVLFFLYLWMQYQVSGDWLAFLNIQSSWGHTASTPWSTLFVSASGYPWLDLISRLVVVLFITLLVIYLWKYPHKEWGIFGVLLVTLPLFVGPSLSLGRYCIAVFPAYISLAGLIKDRPHLERWVETFFLVTQAVFFAAWCRFYFVG
jgi:hypothetical protein